MGTKHDQAGAHIGNPISPQNSASMHADAHTLIIFNDNFYLPTNSPRHDAPPRAPPPHAPPPAHAHTTDTAAPHTLPHLPHIFDTPKHTTHHATSLHRTCNHLMRRLQHSRTPLPFYSHTYLQKLLCPHRITLQKYLCPTTPPPTHTIP